MGTGVEAESFVGVGTEHGFFGGALFAAMRSKMHGAIFFLAV